MFINLIRMINRISESVKPGWEDTVFGFGRLETAATIAKPAFAG
jgi:hypothetical protein